ncbi:MAG: NADH dehydrogenase (quinone) subunit D [Candidatus Binatia bacterium]|nr:NADH dehydrogenase (quinone) subunit D [Candidatus Binatia bacterium]
MKKVGERFSRHLLGTHSLLGDDTLCLRREGIVEVCRFLREDPELDYGFMMDLTGVDYSDHPQQREVRFEVVYHLYSLRHNHRVRLRAPVPEEDCRIDSVFSVWEGADWFEREAYDLYGIHFSGHPDLRRILLYDGFEGHPLRKDYPKEREQPIKKASYASPLLQEQVFGRNDGEKRHLFVHMGPAHPAMHGIIHLILELDGERVVRSETEIGYLHRAFEKESEAATYTQVFPYTDRLNYVSPLINNVGYAMAVEKLFGPIEVPERCQYIRVIMSEICRITDHLTCIAANAMELGAFTVFFYFIQAREVLWGLIEEASGGRGVTPTYFRIGGVSFDLPEGFIEHTRSALQDVRRAMEDVDKLLTKNRIFYDRMYRTGMISAEEAIALGFTGPCLRSTGIDYDVRKAQPYLVYDRMEFDIPVGTLGDNYDRYLIRMEEMRQSIRIIEQCLDRIPEGPVRVDDVRISLPPKEEVYSNIEALMGHFKLIIEGIQPPVGEAYFPVEGANGELGFYIISDGTGRPYKCRCRPPCFAIMQGLNRMLDGGYVADIVATFGTINMIGGENDR